MHNVQFEITKPTDEAAFEDMCARIYGTVYKDPHPQTNGRRGQAQGGVDVFVDGPDGRIGVQCKKYADGALKFKHVELEVSKADKASSPIVELIIATTAASDVVLLRDVQELSDQRVAAGMFPVTIEFWQDLCRHISGSGELQNDYAPNAPGAIFHRLEEDNAEFRAHFLRIESKFDAMAGLPSGRADSVNKYVTSQLDAVNDLLVAAKFKDASGALMRLGADMSLLDAHQKARWYVQRGVCSWHLENAAAAAPDFLKAAELFPDDAKIAAAKVRGLLFLERIDEALDAGQHAHARFPASEHVWIAYSNAKLMKGLPVSLADAPAEMREKCSVLQLAAWARRKVGDLAGAVELSTRALSKADPDFFVRSTALALTLEAAASDPVSVANGLVSEEAVSALKEAVEALSPRTDWVWPVQSPESLQDVLVNLGYSHLVLGEPEETLALIGETERAGLFSPRLKRVALEAYRRLDRIDELVRFGRMWLDDLEEEGLVLVAEAASSVGDVPLVEAVQTRVEQKGSKEDEAHLLIRAMRWVALWHSNSGKKVALDEVCAADIANSDSLALICGGARILYAAKDEATVDAAIAKAVSLVTRDTNSAERLMLADLLFETGNLELAANQYAPLAPRGKHSEIHNRLLRCYVRTGLRRKAKELILSFPDTWTSDERALRLAIDLGQLASDWEFLVPLLELHCKQRPCEVGGWLLRLVVDLKMRKMARFHSVLNSIPDLLAGSPSLLAQLASLEMRFGSKKTGMRRLYGLYRRNLEDTSVASAYLIALVVGPTDLPFMEESLPKMCPGAAITLKSDSGERVTLALDPEELSELPEKEEFLDLSSETARCLLGATVGQSVCLPGRFGTEQHFVVERIISVFLWLLELAQERVDSPILPDLPLMSVPIPTTEDGADFSHVHAMVKRQSEHSQRAREAYAGSPITLGILARVLGRNVVDIVSDWPIDGPALFVCGGTTEQQGEAYNLLSTAENCYVVDGVTIVELASLDCLDALEALPQVFISTKSVEMLEARLEEAKLEHASGHLFDDKGSMRFVEYTVQDRKRQTAFMQSMVDAVRQYCVVLPAYGPVEIPKELERAKDVLTEDEFATLLLTAEKNARLFTVDGRLAQLAAGVAGIKSVWPQAVLRYALVTETLMPQRYQLAVVRTFLRNRNFVSLTAHDVVFMCLQGGHVLRQGLQRFKDYISSDRTEFGSAMGIAFEFLELQAQQHTQFGAFIELVEHVVEALLKHPKGERERIVALSREFGRNIARRGVGPFIPFEPGELERQRRIHLRAKFLNEGIDSAIKYAQRSGPRALKLRLLMCSQPPYLSYDQCH